MKTLQLLTAATLLFISLGAIADEKPAGAKNNTEQPSHTIDLPLIDAINPDQEVIINPTVGLPPIEFGNDEAIVYITVAMPAVAFGNPDAPVELISNPAISLPEPVLVDADAPIEGLETSV